MKKIHKRILIVPEGYTEYHYATSLKESLPREFQRGIDIIKPSNESSIHQILSKTIIKINEAKSEKNTYNHVWIIFDNDDEQNIQNCFEKADKNRIQIAYSCKCIEQWFLIHFENNRKPFENSKQVTVELNKLWQKRYKQEYHKTKIKHFEFLNDLKEFAIKNAKSLESQYLSDFTPIEKRNPYFTVHKLIEFFDGLTD